MIHARLCFALAFSTMAHVGLAWVVGDDLHSTAAPAQRALTVAMVPAAPTAVLNSIAPTAAATVSPAVVRPLAPPNVTVIDAPDAELTARIPASADALDAPLVPLRGPERALRASVAPAPRFAVAIAPSDVRLSAAPATPSKAEPLLPSSATEPATSRRVHGASGSPGSRPTSASRAVDGERGAGRDAASPRTVAGQPGADRAARPASGNVPPDYPWTARARGHEGRVVLSVWVDAGGGADRLAVLKSSGYPALDRAAVEAVERWRFRPARRGGVDTGSLVHVPIVFRLDDRP